MCPKVSQPSKPSKKVCILPFLRSLLDDDTKKDIICWTNESKLEFRLLNQKKVAELWGMTKPGRKVEIMSYDNMARSLREFIPNFLVKMPGRTCEYRFVRPLSYGIDQILASDAGSTVSSPQTSPSPLTTPGLPSTSGSPSSIPSTSSGTSTGSINMGQMLPTPPPPVSPDAVALALIMTMTPAQLQGVMQMIAQLPLIQ